MTTVVNTWAVHPEQFWLRGQRPDHPVRYDEELGLCDVYGYPEAQAVLNDQLSFSTDTTPLLPFEVDESLGDGNLLQMGPPDHRKLRDVVSDAFTAKSVAKIAPRIHAVANELLDTVAGQDRIDLVADFAHQLPVTIIGELLGVPSSDHGLFRQWADAVLDSNSEFATDEHSEEPSKAFQVRLEPLRQARDYLRGHAAERRRRPRQDLLTQLVRADIDGERLTDNQVLGLATFLLLAGHVTTTLLLGNTVLCLASHPDQEARVRADRSTLPTAIEESLRFLSPVAATLRATTTEVVLADQRVPSNRKVMVWLGAANRDERQFVHPNRFDAARHPNPHLGFGRGSHFCLGAPLARLEGQIALNVLFDRLPSLRIDPDDPPTFRPAPDASGVATLPLRVG
jgi:cytochrome P450